MSHPSVQTCIHICPCRPDIMTGSVPARFCPDGDNAQVGLLAMSVEEQLS